MSQLMIPDELFNDKARRADFDTPADRFHDLILAVFQSNVNEAYKLHLQYPHREPDTGLVQNAAAWVQELIMPDVSQRDIALRINQWILKEADRSRNREVCDQRAERAPENARVYFM